MDELDHNLLMAFNRVFERCRADPAQARRRFDRVRAGACLDRPHRAWCVAIRASDTRLTGWNEPRASASGYEPGPAPSRSRLVQDTQRCAQAAHEIVLDGATVRGLGGPVWLPYPGLPIDVAADRLGKHKEALRRWLPVRPGRTKQTRAAAGKLGGLDGTIAWQEHPPTAEHPLGVRYEPQRTHGRNSGMETPVVWSDGALDPGAVKGRPPTAYWGEAWMSLAGRVPAAFEQVAERVPRVLPYKGGPPRFRGWWWVCPGIEGRACGRRVHVLYAPLPVWTVGRALGIEQGLDVEGLAGEWLPGVMDRWAGRRSLACDRCWKVMRSTYTNSTGWNQLVGYLTGGLLYGREVEKPDGFAYQRKRAYKARRYDRGPDHACNDADELDAG